MQRVARCAGFQARIWRVGAGSKDNLNAKAIDGGVGMEMELCEVVQESRWWSGGGGNGGGVEF